MITWNKRSVLNNYNEKHEKPICLRFRLLKPLIMFIGRIWFTTENPVKHLINQLHWQKTIQSSPYDITRNMQKNKNNQYQIMHTSNQFGMDDMKFWPVHTFKKHHLEITRFSHHNHAIEHLKIRDQQTIYYLLFH